jgi:hypothetical protein
MCPVDNLQHQVTQFMTTETEQPFLYPQTPSFLSVASYDSQGDCRGPCGLVVRVPGYRNRSPGSIPGATSFTEKLWVWNGVHSAS